MKFEVGKYYRHTDGKKISVIGYLDTTMWGKHSLIGETCEGHLQALGKDEWSATNYKKITKKEWMTSFSK